MMYKPNTSKTIEQGKLCLQTHALTQFFQVVFQSIFIALPFILLSILMTEQFADPDNKSFMLLAFLVLALGSGALLAVRQFFAESIPVSEPDVFQQHALKVLSERGFRIVEHNTRYLMAICTENRAIISDQVYLIFTPASVFVFCLIELPFPFSYMKSRTLLKEFSESS